jgi:hypothetical protein
MFKGILMASVAMLIGLGATAQAATRLGTLHIADEKNSDHDEDFKFFVRPIQCLKAVQFKANRWSANVQVSKVKVSYAIEGLGVKRAVLPFRGLLTAGESTGWLEIPQNGLCVTAFVLEATANGWGMKENGILEVYAQ